MNISGTKMTPEQYAAWEKYIMEEYVVGENEMAKKSEAMQRADARQVGGNHYKAMRIQPWAVMESVLTPEEFIGFLKGSVIKYSMRAGHKGPDDAEKALHYMQKLDETLAKYGW